MIIRSGLKAVFLYSFIINKNCIQNDRQIRHLHSQHKEVYRIIGIFHVLHTKLMESERTYNALTIPAMIGPHFMAQNFLKSNQKLQIVYI